jgi:hydrogenase/urease accessory protein HupE
VKSPESDQRVGRLLLVGVVLVFAAAEATAHELRPGYLEIRETGRERYRVLWKQPARGDLRLAIDPVFPDSCRLEGERARQVLPSAFLDRMTILCDGGLSGKTIAVSGLEATLTDVLVRIEVGDGRVITELLKSRRPGLVVPAAGAAAPAMAYLGLGVEHILLGVDHLMFVSGLLLLVSGPRRLLQTITAFTVGHTLSLALAAFGIVDVPAPPLEAAIVLSIVLLAAEIVRARRGDPSLTARQPAIVAGLFGLVHGLGFASALTEIGLPATALPTALLLFNLGLEIGQIAFVAVVLGLFACGRALDVRWPTWTAAVPIYALGVAAAAWFAQRLSALMMG